MPKSTHRMFCDETGSTGSRFLDPEQPVYAEGGWFIAHTNYVRASEAVKNAERAFRPTATELKGSSLSRNSKGQKFLRNICELVGKSGGYPFIFIVEKRYAVCTKIVETLFDPDYNPTIPVGDTWDPEQRQKDAQFFYDRGGALIDDFAEAYRKNDPAAVRTNAENWATMLRISGHLEQAKRVAGVLPNIEKAIEIERKHLESGKFPSGMDSLNLPIVTEIFQFVEQHCPFPCDIIHDQTSSFEPLYEFNFKLLSKPTKMVLEMKDGRRWHIGLKNTVSLSFADSRNEPLIRAADYGLAGTRRFVALAQSNEPIPEDLTVVAFSFFGPLLLAIYKRLHPSMDEIPDLTRVMASNAWTSRVLTRLHEEIQRARI